MMGIMTVIMSFIYEVLILDQKLYQMLDVVIHTQTHKHTQRAESIPLGRS